MSKRVFVKVLLDVDFYGKITPKELTWPDGKKYMVDRVLDVRPAPAKSGGSGMRYLCRICGHDVPVYHCNIRGKWWCDGKDG